MLGRLQRQQAETGTSTTPVKSVRVSNASSSVAGRIQRTQAETKPSASVVEQIPTPETKKKTKVTKDDIGIGIGAAILRTATNLASMGEKVLQIPTKVLGMKYDKKTSAEKLQSYIEKKTGKEEGTLFDPQNEAQEVTQALTDIAMYFIPGGAATKLGTAARVAETARVASLAAKGKKLTGLAKLASKAVPYLAEGTADAVLSSPLVAAQSKGADNLKKELAINTGISVVAPGLFRVAGKGIKNLAGRLLRKGKVVEETIEQASKLADELVPAEKNVDELTKAKTALNESIEAKPIEIPGKGNTIQNGAEMAARQADNITPKVEGRIQRAAEETKPTKFAQTVAKSEITEPQLAKKLTDLEPRYSTVTNPETQARAINRIATEGTERAASYVRNAVNVDADVTATGVELIKKYQAEKSFDLAADMAVDVSEKLSKAGQAIQAAKIYENLSPESVLVRAQRFIAEQNSKDVLFAGKRKLTEADAESLYEIAKKMQTLNGEAKTELAAEIGGILGSYKRASVGKKLSSIQTQAQLLNPKTFARNIIGNELFYRLERITKLIATPIDIARSKLTGTERTITFKTGNQEKFWKNWITGTKAGWKGIDIGPNTVYDIKNHTFKNKLNPFYWGEKAVGAMLKGFDFAAYKRAYGETLYELAYLKAKKEGVKDIKKRAIQLLDKMDAKAYELADQYGKYVTFQDDSLLAQGAVKLKKALNLGQDFGFGDLLLKYPRTPGNLLDRALDYSPVGFVKSFKTIAGPILFGTKKGIAQNREIAMATARAVVGSLGFTGFGYFLADKGMITGKRSSNKNVNALEEEMGRGEYKINVSAIKRFVMSGFQNTRIQDGDTYFTYDWAQPVSVALSIGANMNGGTGAGVIENIASGVNTLVEQPLLSGVLNFMKYGDVSKSITTTAEGVGASFTPTFLNQFRQYVDNVKRQTRGSSFLETSMNRIKNRIPGQSTDLAPQVGSLGNVKQVYENNNVFNVFLNPGNVTRYKEIPEAKLVLDLIEQTGEDKHAPKVLDKTATLFGRSEIITPLEQAAMQQYAGDQIMKSLNIAANSEQFKALSPEEQVDVISKKLTEIGSNIRNILMAKRAKEAKDANDTEAIKFMQENVSPTDAIRFNAAYQYLKEKNPFEIRMPEKEEKKEELIDKVDKGALPALGVGLGLAIATKGKKTEMLEKELSKVAPKLTTKILEFFTGKGDVSRQFVEDLLKKDGISKVEKEIVSKALSTEGSRVNTTLFARKVVDELLPLKIKEDTLKGKWKNIALNEDLRGDVQRYAEHIYESPYSTNSGKIHFEGRTEKYFGHVRLEDHPDDVRRIIEVQSDLYQKGRIDTYENGEAMKMLLDDPVKYKADQGVAKKRLEELERLKQYNDPSAHFRMVREEVKKAAEDGKKKLQFPTGETGMRIEKLGAEISEEIFEGKDIGDIVDLQERAWEIQYIDRADKEVYLIPDGAMEQLRSDLYDDAIKSAKENYPDWFDKKGRLLEEYEDDVEDILEEIVEESDELAQMTERFTFGGLDHDNPIYKFYDSTLGKYLKNNYNAKVVTDSKGITWNEIEIKPEYAKKPVQAFGLAGLSTGGAMQGSEDEDKKKKGKIIAGVGLGLALASKGKKTDLLEQGVKKLFKSKAAREIEGDLARKLTELSSEYKMRDGRVITKGILEIGSKIKGWYGEQEIIKINKDNAIFKMVDDLNGPTSGYMLADKALPSLKSISDEVFTPDEIRSVIKTYNLSKSQLDEFSPKGETGIRKKNYINFTKELEKIEDRPFNNHPITYGQIEFEELKVAKPERIINDVSDYSQDFSEKKVFKEAVKVFDGNKMQKEIVGELTDDHFEFKNGMLVSAVGKTGKDTLRNRIILRTSDLYNPNIDIVQKGSAYEKLTPALAEALESLNLKPTKPIKLYRSISDPNLMSKEKISYWTRSKVSMSLYSDYAVDGASVSAIVNPEEILFDTNLLTREEKLLKYGSMTNFNESKEVLVRSKDVYKRLGTSIFDRTEYIFQRLSKEEREKAARKYLGFKDDFESARKLLATHQTTEDGLRGIIKDKKIWGPSVAVFDKEKVKNIFGFGEYVAIVNKNSVNPANKEVMMFTDDVFSPRMISSEASLKKLSKDVSAGKDILGGEITTGETPVHTYLAKRLKSYDELREASSKLGTREDAKNSYISLYQAITEGFEEIVPGEYAEVMGFSRLRDEAEGMVRELIKKDKFTPEEFAKRMKKELRLKVDTKDATEYVNRVQAEMSTFKVEYFEAKILKGLDLSEIDTVLVPETASIELLTMLNKAGIRTEVYEKTNLSDAFKKVSSSAFGLGIIPFGFFNTNLLKKKLDALKSRKEELKKQNEELQMKVDEAIKQRNDTPAKITVYNPDPAQTDDTPHEGSFMTKMEFGDVAVGNRKEHDDAKQKFFKEKKDTFIIIPELAKIKTPYGYGKFRVRDTMNLRYDGQGRLDIFIPEGMEDIDKEIRKTPNGTYFYLKDK